MAPHGKKRHQWLPKDNIVDIDAPLQSGEILGGHGKLLRVSAGQRVDIIDKLGGQVACSGRSTLLTPVFSLRW